MKYGYQYHFWDGPVARTAFGSVYADSIDEAKAKAADLLEQRGRRDVIREIADCDDHVWGLEVYRLPGLDADQEAW